MTGNPNTGKSTIFNELTGARQKIGNWPGVTVDKKVGYTRHKDRAISIVDLPGTYSVNARSPEEKIVIDYLMNNKLDLVMDVVDSSNIERNLFLTVQLLEQGIPLLIDLNMQDDAARRGIKIDVKKLEEAIGMPVVETVGRSSKSTKKLLDVFTSTVMSQYHVSPQVQEHIDKVQAIKASSQSESDKEEAIIEARYALIDKIMAQAVDMGNVGQSKSEKIDHFLANGFLALPIFLLILYAVFQITFTWIGQPIADFLDDAINTDFVDFMTDFLTDAGVADWMVSLVCDGIISGVGAVLTFVPLIFVLFFCLSFLDGTGYMARIAFIMDRIFRRFGLSGKSFIPMLVGTGCGVPGVMASRTIENERDRRMTIMTTCFIPCGAKMPIIGLFAGALFGGSSWVATSAYFIGFAAIIISGIILKKTKLFAGDPAPFVMELPAYHVPAWGNVLRATWERGWSFIKRAGTVILASTIILWFLQGFGFENGAFTMVEDQDNSILAIVASAISWIFIPQGFGDWRATVASISGLIAKENVVGTFGVLYHFGGELSDNGDEIWPEVAANFTALSAYSFMIFNLLCAPCFAAMGAIKREMNNGKWTAIAIGYMCLLAYCASLVVYQIGGLITGEVGFNFFTIVAVAIIAFTIYLLFRPNKYEGVNEVQFDSKKAVASK